MTRRIETRLAALEAQHAAQQTGPRPIAVQLQDTDEVEVSFTRERTPAEEFRRRYPAGLIVVIHLSEDVGEAL